MKQKLDLVCCPQMSSAKRPDGGTKVCVVGLGYVGTVNLAYLVKRGHIVTGLDISQERINRLHAGESLPEPDVTDVLRAALRDGRLKLSTDYRTAMAGASVAILCINTPQRVDDSWPDLGFLHGATKSLAEAVTASQNSLDVVLRSTVLPGTTRRIMSSTLANLRRVWYYPEFLREGSAMEDIQNPPIRIIGGQDGTYPQRVIDLYGETESVKITDYETAETVKYVCNAFHGLKVVFTNEVSQICGHLGVDSNAVMEVVCSDRKLNISTAYMKPGFAFGGSCLPKDLSAFLKLSKEQVPRLPLLSSIKVSNDLYIELIARRIHSLKIRGPVGMLGLSFKPNTGDVRDSPFLRLAEMLISAGHQIIAYDPSVELSPFCGTSKPSREAGNPIGKGHLLKTIDLLHKCSLLLLAHPIDSFDLPILPLLQGKRIIDLCNDPARERIAAVAGYEGAGWRSDLPLLRQSGKAVKTKS